MQLLNLKFENPRSITVQYRNSKTEVFENVVQVNVEEVPEVITSITSIIPTGTDVVCVPDVEGITL